MGGGGAYLSAKEQLASFTASADWNKLLKHNKNRNPVNFFLD